MMREKRKRQKVVDDNLEEQQSSIDSENELVGVSKLEQSGKGFINEAETAE